METPAQKTGRLVGALEELIEQEGMYLRGGYYDLAVEVRERTAPLVEQLVRLARQPEAATWQPRIEVAVTRSQAHATFLQEKMDELRAELRQIEQARHRTVRVLPAYAPAARAIEPRFLAAG